MANKNLGGEAQELRLGEIVTGFSTLDGPLLPILHAIQAEFGHVPKAAIPIIADILNLSRADVHGVVSFYHDFRDQPGGRHTIKLCRAEACQSMGGDGLASRLLGALGLEWGQTSQDGAVSVDAVYCLGLCACAPAAMVDGEVIGRLDASRIDAILGEVRR